MPVEEQDESCRTSIDLVSQLQSKSSPLGADGHVTAPKSTCLDDSQSKTSDFHLLETPDFPEYENTVKDRNVQSLNAASEATAGAGTPCEPFSLGTPARPDKPAEGRSQDNVEANKPEENVMDATSSAATAANDNDLRLSAGSPLAASSTPIIEETNVSNAADCGSSSAPPPIGSSVSAFPSRENGPENEALQGLSRNEISIQDKAKDVVDDSAHATVHGDDLESSCDKPSWPTKNNHLVPHQLSHKLPDDEKAIRLQETQPPKSQDQLQTKLSASPKASGDNQESLEFDSESDYLAKSAARNPDSVTDGRTATLTKPVPQALSASRRAQGELALSHRSPDSEATDLRDQRMEYSPGHSKADKCRNELPGEEQGIISITLNVASTKTCPESDPTSAPLANDSKESSSLPSAKFAAESEEPRSDSKSPRQLSGDHLHAGGQQESVNPGRELDLDASERIQPSTDSKISKPSNDARRCQADFTPEGNGRGVQSDPAKATLSAKKLKSRPQFGMENSEFDADEIPRKHKLDSPSTSLVPNRLEHTEEGCHKPTPTHGSNERGRPALRGGGQDDPDLRTRHRGLPQVARDRPPNSRIFVGNLATEFTSVEELASIFERYGPLTEEPVVRRSFGFIQFGKAEHALAAVRGEQGRMIGGISLDLTIADNREVRQGAHLVNNTPYSLATKEEVLAAAGSRVPLDQRGRSSGGTRSAKRRRSRSPTQRLVAPRGAAASDAKQVLNFESLREQNRMFSRNDIVARVVSLSPQAREYACQCEKMFRDLTGLCADTMHIIASSLGECLGRALKEKVPYILVVATKDVETQTCSIRALRNNRYEKAGDGKGIISFRAAMDICLSDGRIAGVSGRSQSYGLGHLGNSFEFGKNAITSSFAAPSFPSGMSNSGAARSYGPVDVTHAGNRGMFHTGPQLGDINQVGVVSNGCDGLAPGPANHVGLSDGRYRPTNNYSQSPFSNPQDYAAAEHLHMPSVSGIPVSNGIPHPLHTGADESGPRWIRNYQQSGYPPNHAGSSQGEHGSTNLYPAALERSQVNSYNHTMNDNGSTSVLHGLDVDSMRRLPSGGRDVGYAQHRRAGAPPTMALGTFGMNTSGPYAPSSGVLPNGHTESFGYAQSSSTSTQRPQGFLFDEQNWNGTSRGIGYDAASGFAPRDAQITDQDLQLLPPGSHVLAPGDTVPFTSENRGRVIQNRRYGGQPYMGGLEVAGRVKKPCSSRNGNDRDQRRNSTRPPRRMSRHSIRTDSHNGSRSTAVSRMTRHAGGTKEQVRGANSAVDVGKLQNLMSNVQQQQQELGELASLGQSVVPSGSWQGQNHTSANHPNVVSLPAGHGSAAIDVRQPPSLVVTNRIMRPTVEGYEIRNDRPSFPGGGIERLLSNPALQQALQNIQQTNPGIEEASAALNAPNPWRGRRSQG